MSEFLLAFCFAMAVLTATGQTVSHKIRKSAHQPKPPVINARESQETCIYTDLSKSLLFKTRLEPLQVLIGKRHYDSCQVKITVLNKSNSKAVFTTTFLAGFLYGAYEDCNTVRSYVTGKNQSASAPDNDYGNLIVADFNFDSREDFAIKIDQGGNGGPFYRFCLQKSNGQFEVNTFLTEEMAYFPERFDTRRHTLTTLTHANARELYELTYQVNTKNGRWHKVSQRFVPYSAVSR